MNTLSWFLYAADSLSALGATAELMSFILGVVTAGLGVVSILNVLEEGVDERFTQTVRRALRWAASLFVIALVLNVLIPSRTTMYAIAASELGEKAIQTQTASKAMKALDAWLDRQIAEPQKEDDK